MEDKRKEDEIKKDMAAKFLLIGPNHRLEFFKSREATIQVALLEGIALLKGADEQSWDDFGIKSVEDFLSLTPYIQGKTLEKIDESLIPTLFNDWSLIDGLNVGIKILIIERMPANILLEMYSKCSIFELSSLLQYAVMKRLPDVSIVCQNIDSFMQLAYGAQRRFLERTSDEHFVEIFPSIQTVFGRVMPNYNHEYENGDRTEFDSLLIYNLAIIIWKMPYQYLQDITPQQLFAPKNVLMFNLIIQRLSPELFGKLFPPENMQWFIRLIASSVSLDMQCVMGKLSPDSMRELLGFLPMLIESTDRRNLKKKYYGRIRNRRYLITREQYNAKCMIIHMLARMKPREVEDVCRQYGIEIIKLLASEKDYQFGLFFKSNIGAFYVRSSSIIQSELETLSSYAKIELQEIELTIELQEIELTMDQLPTDILFERCLESHPMREFSSALQFVAMKRQESERIPPAAGSHERIIQQEGAPMPEPAADSHEADLGS